MGDNADPKDGKVSPPTRGWTRETWKASMLDNGFPAHAGMDLITCARCLAMGGFPRPRGDGPR